MNKSCSAQCLLDTFLLEATQFGCVVSDGTLFWAWFERETEGISNFALRDGFNYSQTSRKPTLSWLLRLFRHIRCFRGIAAGAKRPSARSTAQLGFAPSGLPNVCSGVVRGGVQWEASKRVPPVPRLGISPGLTLDGVASHGLAGKFLGCAPSACSASGGRPFKWSTPPSVDAQCPAPVGRCFIPVVLHTSSTGCAGVDKCWFEGKPKEKPEPFEVQVLKTNIP